ncbi:MAG: hypothetical protein ABIP53_12225 [Candidatus Limnocylindrales bacterium]
MPHSAKVDLEKPVFSAPTSITNPLFPRVGLTQTVQLGIEAGDKLRFEVTLLPDTKVIDWGGQAIETRVTHFMAYSNGRILEVALDFYAQADDGSVWYFGEDVFNYEDGVVVDNEGTWLAGKDGPPGMIMPADPKVGDVYRPENIPGVVFEEVTVQAVSQTVGGPRGPVSGAIFVQEHLMDGTSEDKVFAPGYGEFRAQVVSLDEMYGVAFAVPIDALPGTVPGEIAILSSGAAEIMSSSATEDWIAISATLRTMTDAWQQYQAAGVPERLDVQMSAALDAFSASVDARDPQGARQAAIGVARASLDFELSYRPIADVDLDRLALWVNQLHLDLTADDAALVLGDVAVLEAIWDRVDHAVSTADAVDAALAALREAVDAEGMALVSDALGAFRTALQEVTVATGG